MSVDKIIVPNVCRKRASGQNASRLNVCGQNYPKQIAVEERLVQVFVDKMEVDRMTVGKMSCCPK
jgi:hypothetical protein